MNNLAKKFNELIAQELEQNILPVKTKQGILVGNVLIEYDGSLKKLRNYKDNQVFFNNVYLNFTAIALAEQIAKQGYISLQSLKIYHADQYYGRWFDNNHQLQISIKQAQQNGNSDLAEILEARYSEGQYRVLIAKQSLMKLIHNR